MKNGMIVFMGDQRIPGPKLLDIEITNTFPLITLNKKAFWYKIDGEKEDISRFDHISIPPDLRLHLSSAEGSRFLNVEKIWRLRDENNTDLEYYFTFIGSPYKHSKPLVENGETKKWEGGSVIVSPFPGKDFNENTRLFVDFFLHNKLVQEKRIDDYRFFLPDMRLAFDRNGSCLGPHYFSGLQRRKKYNNDLMFTIRFGYIEMDDNTDSVYFYSPLPEFNLQDEI